MTHTLDAGDAAPAFSLACDDGSIAALAAYAGRNLILYFYPKDDTPGCTTEALDFSELLPGFSAAGADILGVSRNTLPEHLKFRKKHGLQLRLASDEDGSTCLAYGVWKQKSLYGRTFMGIERTTLAIGPDGVIRKVWRKVRVNGHAAAVLHYLGQP